MLAALERYLPECSWLAPAGGLCIWVKLPTHIDERQLYLTGIQRGIGMAPGSAFYVLPDMPPAMRLSFSSNSPARIRKGIAILSQVIHEQPDTSMLRRRSIG
ncbi:hypothetical protein [Dictyobacter kobayashii]|uniref:Aminotransferase class I/classII domain-containing protein n=1 Tax=Dictyobacter kobayashii TaxID=2014872 RepID=A0A402ATW2_9CHLR|nr:hypothetical protein [Dictyobacter kobayashii]GCE22463.1 hypothetical protein KDK_62630 [Dictyobacter kobayashii]